MINFAPSFEYRVDLVVLDRALTPEEKERFIKNCLDQVSRLLTKLQVAEYICMEPAPVYGVKYTDHFEGKIKYRFFEQPAFFGTECQYRFVTIGTAYNYKTELVPFSIAIRMMDDISKFPEDEELIQCNEEENFHERT